MLRDELLRDWVGTVNGAAVIGVELAGETSAKTIGPLGKSRCHVMLSTTPSGVKPAACLNRETALTVFS
jgi:hypothetical protein